MSHAVERIWAADGPAAWALTPLSWLYQATMAARNAAYDLGVLRSVSLGAPTVSVGNLSVGGTGKTPIAAWIASTLQQQGLRPAVLLRGYGDDEPLVHQRLNPRIPVVANPDRVAGASAARAQGATAFVLDDGFQHRRVQRALDIVLVAAEQWRSRRVLPAGPLREGLGALRRAHVIVVTRKSASRADAVAAAAEWTAFAGSPPSVVISLVPGELRPALPDDATAPMDAAALRGHSVLAVSAIGAPAAFEAQLGALGARVQGAAYADHHAFTDADVTNLAARAASVDYVVCTLKDAVKLGPRWPRQAPRLWYLSQAVVLEDGARHLEDALRRLTTGGSR